MLLSNTLTTLGFRVFIVVSLLLCFLPSQYVLAQLNATLYLYPYTYANCTKPTGQELQIFPPWTSGVNKCTPFTLGSGKYYQAELANFSPTTCATSLSITVWAASSGYTTCGSAINSTGAIESFNLTVGDAGSTCNLGIGTPSALGGYVTTNLLPYFENVPASCPAAVGPPYQTDLLLFTNSSCSIGTGLYTQVFPPWIPGVQKCTTFYPGPGLTFYQSELLVYNSSTVGCGATLSLSVWAASAGYTTCGSATNFTGAAETGVIAIYNLITAGQCNYATFDQKPVDSGYVSTSLTNYILGYSAATACVSPSSSASPSFAFSSSSASHLPGGTSSRAMLSSSLPPVVNEACFVDASVLVVGIVVFFSVIITA